MKLCIDARPLQNGHRGRGVGVLTQNLLTHMGRQATDDEVTLITLAGKPLSPLFRRERRIETRRLERPNRFNWLADQLLLPGVVAQSGAEVFLATDFNSYLIPRGGTRVVSLAYDLIPFIFRETMASQPLSVRLGLRTNFPKLKESTAVIAISQATKNDLVRRFDLDPARISVVYPGIDHSLFNLSTAGDETRRRELLDRLGMAGSFFLYVGDSEWRKNLRRVLEAFAATGTGMKIVLAGKRALTDSALLGWIEELGLQGRVVLPGFVADADLPLLYGAATAFVFPSLYEGFGLPVAEAMACGCPVITSTVSSLPEVAGEAALLVDPCKVAEISAAMVKVLKEPELRGQMIAAGLRQAEQFSWERAAQETLTVIAGAGGRG